MSCLKHAWLESAPHPRLTRTHTHMRSLVTASLTCNLRLNISCRGLPAGACCWCCSGACVLETLHDTEPTPGPAAGSSLLTSSHTLGRSNRNLTCRMSVRSACAVLCAQLDLNRHPRESVLGHCWRQELHRSISNLRLRPYSDMAGRNITLISAPVQLSQMHQMAEFMGSWHTFSTFFRRRLSL